MHWKNNLLLVAIFLLGIVAGFGLGSLYGTQTHNAQLESQVEDLQVRYQTVNDNFVNLVREYNKLFALQAPIPVASTNQSTAAVTPAAPKTTVAPTAAKPTATPAAAAKPATATTGSSSSAPAAAKPKSGFSAKAINGSGPLEGPPPLDVQFTDESKGNINSWKWEFGDGQTSTEKSPKHTYSQNCPGDQNLCSVKLTVCGPDGCDTKVEPDYILVSEGCSGC